MACSNLTGGILDLCNNGFAGVQTLYIANGPTESFVETAGVVSDIVVAGVSLVPADFYTFQLPRQTANLIETATANQENGTLMFQQDLTVSFNQLEAEKRNKLLLMLQATSMICVAMDNNGRAWSIGLSLGCYASTATADTGTAYSDRGGYTITLSGTEKEPMYEVDSAIFLA